MSYKSKNVLSFIFITAIWSLAMLSVYNSIKQTELKKSVKLAVHNSREVTEPSTDANIVKISGELKNKGIATTQIAASKVDICKITSYDQGWFVAGHTQSCYFRYVEGYTTKMTQSQIVASVNQSFLKNLTGELNEPRADSPCDFQSLPTHYIELHYLPIGLSQSVDWDCVIPNPFSQYFLDARSEERTANDPNMRISQTFNPVKIDRSQNLIDRKSTRLNSS